MKKLLIILALLIFPATILEAQQYTIGWSQSTGTVDGYVLHYGAETGVYDHNIDVGLVQTYALDLPAGVYYFAVSAYNSVGDGGNSVEAYLDSVPLGAVGDLSDEPVVGGRKILWPVLSGAESYRLTMKTAVDGAYTQVAKITGTNYDLTLAPGEYWFQVVPEKTYVVDAGGPRMVVGAPSPELHVDLNVPGIVTLTITVK